MKHNNIIDYLQSRGLIEAITNEELKKRLEKPSRVYIGFDPTADSLHLGNFVGIMMLAHFQRFGHTPVIILGGATGRIGDPSGKSKERPFLDDAAIRANIASIRKNFETVLDFEHKTAKPIMLNNDDWLASFHFIDFLRDIGKHFRINQMLAKEMVRSRLESEEGMSYTEFSYQILQAYDFYHLFTEKNVILEMGGSDQWGNITAGIELIRKLSGETAFGLTFPLLTRSDGKKFGKTEEGAIWLSPDKLSPYEFYQYLFRMPDADVIKLMRMITFMDIGEIAQIEESMKSKDYIPNSAQKRLAEEVTRIVHGEKGLALALRVTLATAPGSKAKLDLDTLKAISHEMPHVSLDKNQLLGQKFVDIAVKSGILASKGEATRLIQNGGAYLNDEKVEDAGLRIEEENLIGGQYLLIGAGKKKKILIKVLA
ncbi:MAG TPA: tyrosine--tRNA ligase [Rhabdochlamydiaceae bacterium]|nr:tyrosine--tRNA ligase [Rhabdochlamydiaceae bacterium]